MPDFPPGAIRAAVLALQAHPWPDGEVTEAEVTRLILDAAWPHLAGAVAKAITEHKYAHEPKGPLIGGKTAEEQRRRTWRRHLGIASRVAATALFTEDELKRQADEAIKRGDYVACNLPEDWPDHGTAENTPENDSATAAAPRED